MKWPLPLSCHVDVTGDVAHGEDVQVRRLWGDRYRVNVLVGDAAATARVAHSYFLAADGSGNIKSSDPAIGRRYLAQ